MNRTGETIIDIKTRQPEILGPDPMGEVRLKPAKNTPTVRLTIVRRAAEAGIMVSYDELRELRDAISGFLGMKGV